MTYTHCISFGVIGKSENVPMRGEKINTPMTVKDVLRYSSQPPSRCGIQIYFQTSLREFSGGIVVNLNRLGGNSKKIFLMKHT